MEICELCDENYEDCEKILPPEYRDEALRRFRHAYFAREQGEEHLTSGILWEVDRIHEKGKTPEARIIWFSAQTKEAGEWLLAKFHEKCRAERVSRAVFELNGASETEKEAFKAAGFELRQVRSEDFAVGVGELLKHDPTEGRLPRTIKSISDLSSYHLRSAVMQSVFAGRYGLAEDLEFLPEGWFDPVLSCCMVKEDVVTGLLLLHRLRRGLYRMELLNAAEPDVPLLLSFMTRQAKEYCGKDEEILFRQHDHAVALLVQRFFPDKKVVKTECAVKKSFS